jgi:PX domain
MAHSILFLSLYALFSPLYLPLDFERLYEFVRTNFPTVILPLFPEKKWFGRMATGRVEVRRAFFHEFVRVLLMEEEVWNSEVFQAYWRTFFVECVLVP